jgi:hypothetical protein
LVGFDTLHHIPKLMLGFVQLLDDPSLVHKEHRAEWHKVQSSAAPDQKPGTVKQNRMRHLAPA